MLKEKYKKYGHYTGLENANVEQIRLLGAQPFFMFLNAEEKIINKSEIVKEFLIEYPPYYPEVYRQDKNYTQQEILNKKIYKWILARFYEYLGYTEREGVEVDLDYFVKGLKINAKHHKFIRENIINYKLNNYLLNT